MISLKMQDVLKIINNFEKIFTFSCFNFEKFLFQKWECSMKFNKKLKKVIKKILRPDYSYFFNSFLFLY